MKFEKHLKATGINGVIYKASNGALFLRNGVFGNVLMRIPEGLSPISTMNRDLDKWMDDIVTSCLYLTCAQLADARIDPDGKPKDIKRIYRDIRIDGNYGDRLCTINQDAYTLIENRDDVRIYMPHMIDDPEEVGVEPEIPALAIVNRNEEVIGIILSE